MSENGHPVTLEGPSSRGTHIIDVPAEFSDMSQKAQRAEWALSRELK